jgi:hypothetical protein
MRPIHFIQLVLSAVPLAAAFACGRISDDSVYSTNDNDAGNPPVSDAGRSLFEGGDQFPPGPTPLSGVTLFAGYGEAPLSDTWVWNGSSWTEALVTGPSERDDSSMATLGSTVVLFGGEFGSYLGDTWTWDGLVWTQQDITGPSPRSGAPMVPLGNRLVLYAGSGDTQLDDTWSYDGKAWTQIATTGPGGFHDSGSAMAVLGDKIYLFGGVGADSSTWSFDGSTWTNLGISGPPARAYHTMSTITNAGTQKIVLFGGEVDASHFLGDTWIFDGAAWTQLSIAGPSARFHAAMAQVPRELSVDTVLLFGGGSVIGQGPPLLGDTWSFDGSAWTQVASTGPSARNTFEITTRLSAR